MATLAVLQSKLSPPRLRPPVLERSRIHQLLEQGLESPYVLVQAGAGYGKSVAVHTFLQHRAEPWAWYSLDEADADPGVFCAHLIAAITTLGAPPSTGLNTLLSRARRGKVPWVMYIDAFMSEMLAQQQRPVWLVLDDIHLLARRQDAPLDLLDHFLAHLPPVIHVILISRHWPQLSTLVTARARSQLLTLGQAELAFDQAETASLLRQHLPYALAPVQIERLCAETEGWVIALQLLAHQLHDKSPQQIAATLDDLPRHLQALFDFLAENIIARQTPELQQFLLSTSILRQLDPPACDAIRLSDNSEEMLRALASAGLSLVQLDSSTYRHHYLIREFLERNLSRDRRTWRILHRRAAAFYAQQQQVEESIHHLLQAQDYEAAAHQISALAPALLQGGRLNTLANWLGQLPASTLDDWPDLRIIQGDVARFTSAYDAALQAYQQAENAYLAQGDVVGHSRALTSQGLVYIDTVRPAAAEAFLKQALRVLGQSHPHESARLLRLMAENACNRGRPNLAGRWYAASQRLKARPDPRLEARIHLRSGRLSAALALLEPSPEEESKRPARSHREPSLLLSFIYALQGHAWSAYSQARTGLDLARRLNSPFTEAVAHMRLAHAWQLPPMTDVDQALEHYRHAMRLTRRLKVARGEAEPQFGLTLLHAHSGHHAAAQEAGQRCLELAEGAGDEWVAGLALLALAIDASLRDHLPQALTLCNRAQQRLEACTDRYGLTLAWLWQAWIAHRHGQETIFRQASNQLLPHLPDYPFLLTRPTLFGLRDPQQIYPLLTHALELGIHADITETLLAQAQLSPQRHHHPGYTLRIHTLGDFTVWRGDEAIRKEEWRRTKARRLLQLLLHNHPRRLSREEIIERLWPELPLKTAENRFKVTLNALQRALEPHRPSSAPPFFIVREGNRYGLNPAAVIRLDVERFEQLLDQAQALRPQQPAWAITLYEQALQRYQGDYLPDALYEDWTMSERRRLQLRYLQSTEALARLLLSSEPLAAISWCERILALDSTWEPAYRLTMRGYAALGQRHLLARTYQRCVDTLRQELNLPPDAQTSHLYHLLVHGLSPEE